MTKMIDREQVRKAVMKSMEEVVEHVCGVAEKGDVTRLDEQFRRATLAAAGNGLAALCRQLADESAAPDCPNCGGKMRFKQWRPFVLRSGLTGGSLTLQSPYFVCDHCHVGALPLRQRLGLDHDGFTPLLRDLAIRAGTLEPFEEASTEVLERIAGVRVSGSKIHELCKAAGEAAAALANEGALGKARPLKPGEKLYVEVDGGSRRPRSAAIGGRPPLRPRPVRGIWASVGNVHRRRFGATWRYPGGARRRDTAGAGPAPSGASGGRWRCPAAVFRRHPGSASGGRSDAGGTASH